MVEDRKKHWGRASQTARAFSRVLLQLVPKLHAAIDALSLLPKLCLGLAPCCAHWTSSTGKVSGYRWRVYPRQRDVENPWQGRGKTGIPPCGPSLMETATKDISNTYHQVVSSWGYILSSSTGLSVAPCGKDMFLPSLLRGSRSPPGPQRKNVISPHEDSFPQDVSHCELLGEPA